jgi:hypothetical protein
VHPAQPATARSFIAFAPYGVGVDCALFYFKQGRDIYGWWMGARDSECHCAYFKLEDYFSTRPTRFYVTEGPDLYGGWRFMYSARIPRLRQAVVQSDGQRHEDAKRRRCDVGVGRCDALRNIVKNSPKVTR